MSDASDLATHEPVEAPLRQGLRWGGRVLVLAWAAFWTWFNLASLVGEIADHGVGAWINHGLFAAVIVAITVLTFVRPLAGGIALLVLTVGMGFLFGGAQPLVLAMLLLPPALGGLLAIVTRRRPHE